ncbi:E3 ubiquitin-protein ligase Mdm2-like [Cylas formicarius]|uniref:E3 ubiquitin-protein ligase Mdm2-like n=1 Tax=Cylas formicarius TaxID=197179 RepID=UPI0029588955|nr:E3 ubiquitin-protein ligase Mdm2-like [Cylas formicarius]
MSATLESNSGSPWRKRAREDDASVSLEIKELKRPRMYYFRLESESSKASEDDTESVYSLQDRATDIVRDTSDTDSRADMDEYEVEIEYEVASLSEDDERKSLNSSSDSEGMVLSAAAAFIIDTSIEAWVTDVEDSDSSSDETSFGRTDFSTCVQCKGENDNPLYRYCEKCFQERKKFFPPRPRRNRRGRVAKNKKPEPVNSVKLDLLRNCLTNLSHDSGIGSSQEFPSLELDRIVVPEYKGAATRLSSVEGLKVEPGTRRKRKSSESSLSDYEVKRARKQEWEVDSASGSFTSSVAEKPNDETTSELCLFCNNAPKDSIFLHTTLAHRCCCYPCAKKTLKTTKRCPICNRSVNKVLRIFTS